MAETKQPHTDSLAPQKGVTSAAPAVAHPVRRRRGQRPSAAERAAAQETFLASFAKLANVTAACKAAGISRETFYAWRQEDKDFGAQFTDADAAANDVIRGEILRRAVMGVDKPLHFQGRLVTDQYGRPVTVKEYSDTLLIFLAKARMPNEFRDKVNGIGVDGQHVRITIETDAVPAPQAASQPQTQTPQLDSPSPYAHYIIDSDLSDP